MERSIIKFEIPVFGLVKLTPENLQRLLDDLQGLSGTDIRKRLVSGDWEYLSTYTGFSRIEWLAIYGECHGYGEA